MIVVFSPPLFPATLQGGKVRFPRRVIVWPAESVAVGSPKLSSGPPCCLRAENRLTGCTGRPQWGGESRASFSFVDGSACFQRATTRDGHGWAALAETAVLLFATRSMFGPAETA